MSGRPSLRVKLLTAAASIVVALLAAELALHALGIGAPGRGSPWFAGGNHPRFLFREHDACGFALRPGFAGMEVAASGEFEVPVAVDARGLRAQPHGAPPAPSILALGDSMTFGEGVAAEATWTALLERMTGVRVDNGGVPGYSSPQMVCLLEELLPLLEPDLVLVALSPLWDAQRCTSPFVYRDGYIVARGYADRLVLVNGNLYAGVVRWPVIGPATAHLQGRSRLARVTLPAAKRGAERLLGRRDGGVRPPSPATWEPCLDRLATARARAGAAGARFLAVLVDSPDDEFRRAAAWVAAGLDRRGVPVLPLDQFIARGENGEGEALRFTRDGHWNAAGHLRVAEALARELAAGGWLPHPGEGP